MIVLSNSVGGIGMGPASQALLAGRAALDAVEIGIRPIELDPTIRSVGVGGWPNLVGEMELDASIMDGRTLQAGSVGALQGFLHPISVARRVLEDLPHVLLVGAGAARFAAETGAETGDILTAESRAEWQAWLDQHLPADVAAAWPNVPLAPWCRLTADPETAHGTTTFLAQDAAGEIATGVSTCGWRHKYPGRLGDSPIIGAGSYADSRYGAAACTGMGELTIRAGTARSVVLYMKMGMSVHEACREALADLRALRRRYRGGVTIHAIDARGEPCVVSIAREWPKADYWIWREGMAAPEMRQVVVEAW